MAELFEAINRGVLCPASDLFDLVANCFKNPIHFFLYFQIGESEKLDAHRLQLSLADCIFYRLEIVTFSVNFMASNSSGQKKSTI